MNQPILYLAPIRGVTSAVYRNEYAKIFVGYDCAVLPFMKSRRIEKARLKAVRDILPKRNTVNFRQIPQILSNIAEDFVQLSVLVKELGYDEVNWNLGCPIPKVRNKKQGSGLLTYPDEVAIFLSKVTKESPCKVSIKVRLGNDSNDELLNLLPELDNFNLSEIIIHPRTGKQMYEGKPDLDILEKCLALTKHDVVYSGDIYSVDDFDYLQKRFKTVKKWMIGRGGIINPFLSQMIKENIEIDYDEKVEKFKLFHDNLFAAHKEDLNGPAHLMAKMKECWYFWRYSFERGDEIYLKVTRIKKLKKYEKYVGQIFINKPKLNF